jgi:hypothetical protein
MSREELMRRWAEREGLETVGVLPAEQARGAVKASLPRLTEAARFAQALEARLGDRAVRGVMAGEGNTALFLRDPQHPRWVMPYAVLALDVNEAPPPELPMPELPASMRPDPAPAPPERPTMLPGPLRCPGSVRLAEGESHLQIRYGPDGNQVESVASVGDSFSWGQHRGQRPYVMDPLAKPQVHPPLSLLCRGDLDPDGHSAEALAELAGALDPARNVRGRVYMPTPSPGGIQGCWLRATWRLREALWAGRVPEEATGWVVIDAWGGTVLAVGADLDEAWERWRAAVARTQPLPPVPPPPKPPKPLPEQAPSAELDEEKGELRLSTGMIRFNIAPRVTLEWPAPRPENVPAAAFPLPPLSALPEAWRGYGFTRRVRLVDDLGGGCTAFVRDEGEGFTMIGEGALPALDPGTLEASLTELAAEQRARVEENRFFFRDRNPYVDPEYPWFHESFTAWDQTGRVPELLAGGVGWLEELAPRGFDARTFKWQVHRWRRVL